jgi:hypothetical protein
VKLFRHSNRELSEASRTVYARFELAHTFVDFMAAFCFIVGSIMFFFETEQIPAMWFFLVGSFLFAVKPTLRLVREIKLYRMGDVKDLAERVK